VQVRVLLSAPSKGYKKDIATENLDFIKVFSVFMGKISANGLNAQKRYFSQNRLELSQKTTEVFRSILHFFCCYVTLLHRYTSICVEELKYYD